MLIHRGLMKLNDYTCSVRINLLGLAKLKVSLLLCSRQRSEFMPFAWQTCMTATKSAYFRQVFNLSENERSSFVGCVLFSSVYFLPFPYWQVDAKRAFITYKWKSYYVCVALLNCKAICKFDKAFRIDLAVILPAIRNLVVYSNPNYINEVKQNCRAT